MQACQVDESREPSASTVRGFPAMIFGSEVSNHPSLPWLFHEREVTILISCGTASTTTSNGTGGQVEPRGRIRLVE